MLIARKSIKIIYLIIIISLIILFIRKYFYSYRESNVYYDYEIKKVKNREWDFVLEKRIGFFTSPAVFRKRIQSENIPILKEDEKKGLLEIKYDSGNIKIELTEESIRYVD